MFESFSDGTITRAWILHLSSRLLFGSGYLLGREHFGAELLHDFDFPRILPSLDILGQEFRVRDCFERPSPEMG